jgi:protein TonB
MTQTRMTQLWLGETAEPARATGLRSLARAFLLSLCVHATLVALLWYLISTSMPSLPREQRVEVELTPGISTSVAIVAAAQNPNASTPDPAATQHVAARSERVAHAPARPVPMPPTLVAPAAADSTMANRAGASLSAPAAAVQPAHEQEAAAIDLRVLEWLARYRTYPLAARRARLEGVVELRVTLLPDGRFVDARVERSSGHVLLDQAALDLLARAAPLPADFASERNAQIELQLPIVYRMRTSS